MFGMLFVWDVTLKIFLKTFFSKVRVFLENFFSFFSKVRRFARTGAALVFALGHGSLRRSLRSHRSRSQRRAEERFSVAVKESSELRKLRNLLNLRIPKNF